MVAGAAVTSYQLTDDEHIPTVQGDNVTIHLFNDHRGEIVLVNQARVTSANNNATNGIVHLIDAVLFPRNHFAHTSTKLNLRNSK